MDPEAWHQIMGRFFQILTDGPSAEGFGPQAGVHRFEGTVNQYTGDGIMALFGAPIHAAGAARAEAHRRFEMGAAGHAQRLAALRQDGSA